MGVHELSKIIEKLQPNMPTGFQEFVFVMILQDV